MKKLNFMLLPAFLGLVCLCEVWAVSPIMVADIRANGDSFPTNFAVYGNTLIYTADDGVHGKELWGWDGSSAALLKDVIPGIGPSDPKEPIVYQESLYFFAFDDAIRGRDLWRWDGTIAEKLSSRNIVNLDTHGFGPKIAVVQNALLFDGRDSAGLDQLWAWDGSQIDKLTSGVGYPGLSLQHFNTFQDNLIFTAFVDEVYGQQIWSWDGNQAVPMFLAPQSEPHFYTPFVTRTTSYGLFFSATDSQRGRELWMWDGLNSPTAFDLWPGSRDSSPALFTEFNGEVYFVASDEAHGRELWKWDGSEASLVADIVPGANSSTPRALTVVNDLLYFAATTRDFGRELWSWDGTEATLVADINPGKKDGVNGVLINYNDSLVFAATDGIHGNELWRLAAVPEPSTGWLAGIACLMSLRGAFSRQQKFVRP